MFGNFDILSEFISYVYLFINRYYLEATEVPNSKIGAASARGSNGKRHPVDAVRETKKRKLKEKVVAHTNTNTIKQTADSKRAEAMKTKKAKEQLVSQKYTGSTISLSFIGIGQKDSREKATSINTDRPSP